MRRLIPGQSLDTAVQGRPTTSVDKRAIARTAGWSSAAWLSAMVTGLPVTIVTVRLLSHGEYGAFSIGATFVTLLSTVGTLGLSFAVAQLIAAGTAKGGPADRIVEGTKRIVRWSAAVGAVAAAAVALLVSVSTPQVGAVLAALIPVVVIAPPAAAIVGELQARMAAGAVAFATSAGALTGAAAMLVLLAAGIRTPAVLAVAVSAGEAARFAALFRARVARRPVQLRSDERRRIERSLLQFGLAMLANSTVWAAISALDVLTVGLVRGSRSAGLYSPVSKLIDFVIVVFGLVGSYLLPVLTGLHARGSAAEFSRMYYWCSRWAVVVVSPFIGALVVAPQWIVRLVFGSPQPSVTMPLRVLATAAGVHAVFGYNGMALEAQARPRAVALRSLLGLGVDILACGVFVPLWGLVGAATATLVAVITINVSCSLSLWRSSTPLGFDGGFVASGVMLILGTGLSGLMVDRLDLAGAGATFTAAGLTAALVAAASAVAEAHARLSTPNTTPWALVFRRAPRSR